VPRSRVDRNGFFFFASYLALGLGGLIYEPLGYFLKDTVKLSPDESSTFIFWMTFPFLLKPLYAAASDFFPWRGYRRRPQVVAACLVALAAWLGMAFFDVRSYAFLLAGLAAANLGSAAADVIGNGVMVEQGKLRGKTGFYQAIELGTLYATIVVSNLAAGWLSKRVAIRGLFWVGAVLPAIVLAAVPLIEEPRVGPTFSKAVSGLEGLIRSRRFWALSAFIFLWSFTPFLGTAQFYYQSEALGFSPLRIGGLSGVEGVCGSLGALVYARMLGRDWKASQIAKACVFAGAPLTLLYVFYVGPVSSVVVTAMTAFGGVALRLSLMDLAAQHSPEFGEATGFAIFMAVFDLAASASNAVGGHLYGWLTRGMGELPGPLPPYGAVCVLAGIGVVTTLCCWPLLRWVAREEA
jgi:MFS family permease